MSAWPDIKGWCADRDRTYLYDLIVARHARTIVEVGVYAGRMTVALAAAARATGGMVHCVDHWREMANGGDIAREFLETLTAHDLQDVVRIYCEASATFAERFLGAIDVLWIDGGHDKATVLCDLMGLGGRATSVLGHDWHLPGVRDAAAEYAASHGFTVCNAAGTDNVWYLTAGNTAGKVPAMATGDGR